MILTTIPFETRVPPLPKHVWCVAEGARRAIFLALAVLIFLPSVTLSVLSAEVFPWALIFCAIFGRGFDKWILLASIYLFSIAAAAQLFIDVPNTAEFVRSLGAYLNSLLIFGVIAGANKEETVRLLKIGQWVFIALIVIGLLQFLGLFGAAEPLITWMIPRASAVSLAERGGRGVTLLASEPARAGIELVSIYLLARISLRTSRHRFIGDVALGIFLLVIIRSVQAMAFYTVFLMIFHNVRLVRIVPVLAVTIFILLSRWDVDARVILLVKDVVEQSSASDIFYLISNNSGHRLTSIISNYTYGFTHPLGGGIGNWHASSVVALNESGLDLSRLNYFKLFGSGEAVSIRASGYVTNLILDVGILGILPVFYALHRVFKRLGAYAGVGLCVTLMFVAKILIFGSVGNPVAWIAAILCLKTLDIHRPAD